jgi:hypothetical protein
MNESAFIVAILIFSKWRQLLISELERRGEKVEAVQ